MVKRIFKPLKKGANNMRQDNETDFGNKDIGRLLRVCQEKVVDRQKMLLKEIFDEGKQPLGLDDGTIVIPSTAENPVALVAHYDNVHGSYGYNDNGMSLVAILGMLNELPSNVEVVFTNGEERGFTGARNYLERRHSLPRYCVNLDVVGVGDRIYIDKLNSIDLDCMEGMVEGCMPGNDGFIFSNKGIGSVCLSASYGDDFSKGISQIYRTIHNARDDNKIDKLTFGFLPQVRDAVKRIVNEVNEKNGDLVRKKEKGLLTLDW